MRPATVNNQSFYVWDYTPSSHPFCPVTYTVYQFQNTYPHTPHLYLLLSISTFIIIIVVAVVIVIMVVLSVIDVIFDCFFFFHGLISAFGSKLLFWKLKTL